MWGDTNGQARDQHVVLTLENNDALKYKYSPHRVQGGTSGRRTTDDMPTLPREATLLVDNRRRASWQLARRMLKTSSLASC